MIQLFNGDCLEEYKKIQSGSIDLILCDPPYGTVKDLSLDGWRNQKTSWDIAINPEDLFKIANRVLRLNGKMILFSQEPYTSRLIQSSFENINFCYRMIWEKDHFANGLVAKKAPVSFYEDILVFYKKYDLEGKHPLREYFSQVLDFIGKTNSEIAKELGHRKAEHCFYVTPKMIDDHLGHQRANHCFRLGSSQFGLCTQETYQEVIDVFGIDGMNGFLEYESLVNIDFTFKSTFKPTFNLPPNQNYKSNILKYSKDYEGLHPTQKPVFLLEDLIKTYSNNSDRVLDFTMGSGSTGIACHNLKRDFIGIEKNEDYFQTAKKRLEEHQKQLRLF